MGGAYHDPVRVRDVRGEVQGDDEHAGRRSKCPRCGAAVEVQFQNAWEEDNSPPPLRRPTPSVPAVPAVLPQIRASEDEDDEPEPYRSPAKPGDEKRRPFWRDPVVVVGAAVPITILTIFFGYLYYDHAEREFERRVATLKTEADRIAQAGEPLRAIQEYENILAMLRAKRFGAGRYQLILAAAETERDRLQAEVEAEAERQEQERRAETEAKAERLAAEKARQEAEKPIHLSDEEMPRMAELFIRHDIISAFDAAKSTGGATVQTIEVTQDRDQRRIRPARAAVGTAPLAGRG
jgi:hypothetical protein